MFLISLALSPHLFAEAPQISIVSQMSFKIKVDMMNDPGVMEMKEVNRIVLEMLKKPDVDNHDDMISYDQFY